MNFIQRTYHRLVWCYDMSKAPKDKPLLAAIRHETIDDCAGCNPSEGGLCLYHGHAEGMDYVRSEYSIIEWGGGFDDRSYEYPNEGHMPDWWFRSDGDFETSANPIAWKLL